MKSPVALLFMAILAISSVCFAARCVEDKECASGEVCILGDCYTPMECKATDECSGTEVCYRGICISPTCIVSAECPTDFRCEDGRCIPKECLHDSYCDAGKKCVNYRCVGTAPEPIQVPEVQEEEEPELAEPAPAQSCPDCACNFMCQPCESKSCPKLECPECGPLDGELGIPILLFGLVVVAALGFFAGKMGASEYEDVKLERIATENDGESEEDINDEDSYRYV
jgi:hypothetical protein